MLPDSEQMNVVNKDEKINEDNVVIDERLDSDKFDPSYDSKQV